MEHCPPPTGEDVNADETIVDSSHLNHSDDKQKSVLMKYVQEKKELQDLLEIKEKSIQEYKAKIYDLTLQIDKKNAPRTPHLTRANGGKSSTKKYKKSHKKKSKSLGKIEKEDLEEHTDSVEDEEDFEEAAKDLARYKEIATRFPELKFSVILEAERRFQEADTNGDGAIDEDELEHVLEKQTGSITTKKEVKNIMKDIDKDDTGTIDMMEYMAVMERVQLRKRTNLPPQLTKSNVCAIQ